MKNFFCRGRLSLLLAIAITTTTYSQKKSLKVGDILPASVWMAPMEVVNYPQKTIKLSEDKNKLILLDFWNTWCSACLANFPKMEELQKQFGDKIKILAVSNQDRATLKKFFASKNGQRYKGVLSVTGDKLFHNLFPHTAVPYIIWIKDGKVFNTTDSGQVSEATLLEALKGGESSLQTVIQIDRKRPLMLSDNFELEKLAHLKGYNLFVKGRIRAITYGSGFHRDGQLVYGRQFTNFSLMNIYRGISYELFEKFGDQFTDKRLINLASKPDEIDFDTTKSGDFDKLYSIEYIVPKEQADSLYDKMLRNVNENSDYTANIEKRPTKCLVLKRTSTQDKIATKGGETVDQFFKSPSVLRNATIGHLISGLNATGEITALPVIDETGYRGNIDLQFSNSSDLKTFQRELGQYDLALVEETRTIPMLVVKDKK
ncbi:hypothetical protein CMU59_06195 [Elizabethkingia anophelis]|uniref:TlpA family protein disulfide reductase n=1 Tax=Elizabethkingia anophelis TaxID=1117645 RepID=UPI0021A7BCC8|nr:thioredoxin family protein [Elizabethkingia anophelis]MCT3947613.1 thioredoxin family protein [Elizabethkingia anophelis]MDV3574573.1 hypothetical protein [Elizabethkingia anophelis]MDV3597913.1 hypothetical protein [Elizabethkingia anophelis]MDV3607429.1 hypothetical protein [Elizabethkingia anophelis]